MQINSTTTQLRFNDIIGSWKARWGINRMNYKVDPGVYSVGAPDKESPVLVTANYKLTFDSLRKELKGLDVWILVIDTKGINVWCAAGKGTFDTEEIVGRIGKMGLAEIVSHRIIVLPQLGAPGVSAHELTKRTGFRVIYGPVRAKDIKEFLRAGMKATTEMREVRFGFVDRLVLTPMELVGSIKTSVAIFAVMFLLNLIAAKPFGVVDLYAFVGTVIAGSVITPILLPWIPGRAFAWKGWLMGMIWVVTVIILNGWPISATFGTIRGIGYLLALPAVSAFIAMNFTGSSTYTSPTGVLKEMKFALPLMVISAGAGIIALLISLFI